MHDRNPKVSVVIPTYNRAHLISRAIQSVLNQTYQDFEIIIVDDGSKDNTEEVVKNLNDNRIRYIRHNTNKGASAARNTGIKASKGEYIAFQDSDDKWFPDKLEQQVKAFDKVPSKVGVVYSGFYRIEGDNKIYIPSAHIAQKEGNIHNELLRRNFIGTPAVLIKKECFENAEYFDETLPALEDWNLWIELSKYYLFKYVNKPLLYSYSTPNSVNRDQKNLFKAREMILRNHFDDFNKDKKILSDYFLGIAVELCSNGDLINGRNYLISALKANYLNVNAILHFFFSFFGKRIYNIYRYNIQKNY
jgi:glycosyltransferase involved in cell wall biosynthesis